MLTRPGGELWLLPDRAVYLPGLRALLVADVHLGKAQSFRRQGVPVPSGTTADNLHRLSSLLQRLRPRLLVFLGDLLHARQGLSGPLTDQVGAWRGEHRAVDMVLVQGNHDRRSGQLPTAWGIRVVEEPWLLDGWALCHHPQTVPEAYVLAGHLHPGVVLGRAADRLRLPCFHIGSHRAVLPAFGAFTGLQVLPMSDGDRLAVVAPQALRWVDRPALCR